MRSYYGEDSIRPTPGVLRFGLNHLLKKTHDMTGGTGCTLHRSSTSFGFFGSSIMAASTHQALIQKPHKSSGQLKTTVKQEALVMGFLC